MKKKSQPTVLIVEDDPEERELFARLIKLKGFDTYTAANGEEAIEKSNDHFFDVVLTDLSMPKMDGMEVLKFFKRTSPETIVIILTGKGSISTAVEAMKSGAYDYITKPFKLDEIVFTLNRALEYRDLKREVVVLKRQLRKKYKFENIVGDSPQIQQVYRLIEKVADTDSTVLILGESGTGKELVARAIHYNSNRKHKPLIPVNCGAIPEELLESELFGHERGAFTHAIKTRIGRFELADGGTIFLDEIGEMSPKLQVKLLRVLQEQRFERIGGMKTIQVDVRIIAATNKDLMGLVKSGKFREDLYYRLNVIPIQLPPLRHRKSDIPLLVDHFLKKICSQKNVPLKRFSEEALKKLVQYDWPGNVRELENLVERMVILTDSNEIRVEDLPERFLDQKMDISFLNLEIPDEGISFNSAVNEFEKQLILQALKKSGGVKNKAAKLLQLNRTTLVEKIKKKKLNDISF